MKNTSPSEEIQTWTTSQVVLATVFVVCVFLSFWLLYRVRLVVLLLFAAIVLGTAIRPGVEWLRERGILRPMGTMFIYASLVLLLAGFLALIVPLVAEQVTQFGQNVPAYYQGFRDWLANSHNDLIRNIGVRIPANLGLLVNSSQPAEPMLDQVTQSFVYANQVLRGIFETLAVFLLAYYWTQESSLIIRTLLRFVPLPRRAGVRDFLRVAEMRMGGYLRGEGILCLVVGSAAFTSYVLIGLPFALVLGIIAGFTEMIPIFGPVLGAIPAALVALSVDPSKVIWVLIATEAIQMLENGLLVPNIMRNAMGVNPIIIILSLVAFGSVFGFLGTLLALPLAAIIQLVIDRIVLTPSQPNGEPQREPVDLDSLLTESHELVQLVNGGAADDSTALQAMPQGVQAEIQAITRGLDDLLTQIKAEGEAQ
ncbi:MAG: AI-2E family transporter [Bacteroidota bacterium]